VAYTNNRDLPLMMAVWLANDRYERNPTYISGSQLSLSNRQLVLGLRVADLNIDLSSLVAARLGHAINDSIDAAWKLPDLANRMKAAGFNSLFEYEINPVLPAPGKVAVYIQQRFNEEVAGRILTGAPDMIMNGRLTDYKSTTVFAYQKKTIEDYLWQLTAYRYLARNLISDNIATIQFILKDWSEMRATHDLNYPQTPCPTLLIPVGSPEQCLARLTARIEELNALMSLDQSDLPLCSDEELWLDPAKFAYYKNPAADPSSRASRVFDTYAEATSHMGAQKNGGKIIVRKGEPKACSYCRAASICEQFANWAKSK
jgi:hypothetical protein